MARKGDLEILTSTAIMELLFVAIGGGVEANFAEPDRWKRN